MSEEDQQRVWINALEQRLSGGHPNSLGQTVEVAEEVLADASQSNLDDLCACYGSADEVVRLRVSSALKRVAGIGLETELYPPRPEWILARFDWLIDDIGSTLDQPSAKWTIAQIVAKVDSDLSAEQRSRAVELLKTNLELEKDWIVQNVTSQTLADIAMEYEDRALMEWLQPRFEKMLTDPRKTVAKRATKLLESISLAFS